jgi:GT2 family glycosyltransferase
MRPADLSFIVPVRNDAAGLRRCLESIRSQTPDAEILIADNGSVDGSPDVARAFGAEVLDLPGLSVSALRNRAAACARGTLLAFVDADMQIAPGWVNAALAGFADPSVAAVGADYSAPPGATWVQRLYDGMRDHRPGVGETRWLASGNMVVRRNAFQQLRGFDETLSTCEDWDFCMRLHEQGLRLLSDGALRSSHFGDPSTLGALFRGELWRGRDNLRVSLRRKPALRDVPGIVTPLLWLVAVTAFVAGLALGPILGADALWLIAPLATAMLLSSVRAVRIWRRVRAKQTGSLAGAWVVALAYDVARALAVLVPVPHRRAAAPRLVHGEQS